MKNGSLYVNRFLPSFVVKKAESFELFCMRILRAALLILLVGIEF